MELTVDIPKDVTKPDGEACWEDGTLKDADEINWLNSPSDNVRIPLLKCLLESEDNTNEKKKAHVSSVTQNQLADSYQLLAGVGLYIQ